MYPSGNRESKICDIPRSVPTGIIDFAKTPTPSILLLEIVKKLGKGLYELDFLFKRKNISYLN